MIEQLGALHDHAPALLDPSHDQHALRIERLDAHRPPPIDPDVEREIDAYVDARTRELLTMA